MKIFKSESEAIQYAKDANEKLRSNISGAYRFFGNSLQLLAVVEGPDDNEWSVMGISEASEFPEYRLPL